MGAAISYIKQSNLLRRIPWLAFASLLVVLMCIGSSVAIIVGSDHQNVDSWRVQPAVLISLLESLSNLALGIAFSVGVAITWWTSARDGASLEQLHYIWDRGEGLSFFPAFIAGANARRVALTASFIIVVKVATGPLLQRATHQRIEDIVTRETMLLNVIRNLPGGWTGTIVNASAGITTGNSQALATAQAWWRNDTIHTLGGRAYYCDGTCEGKVPGAGISYNCSSTTQPLNLYTGRGTVIFEINTTISQDSTGAPFLLLTTLHSSAIDHNCTATLTINTCQITAGTVEYPVIIQNSTVVLDYDKLDNVTILSTYVYPGDLPTATKGAPAGTLQGLNNFYGYYLGTSTTVVNQFSYAGFSMLADMFYQADASYYDDFTFNTCHLKWSSPTKYVLNSMQDFLFRAALRASNGTEAQRFAVQRTKPTLVFQSHYEYLIAAVVITLLGPFFILFTLRGCLSLGRTVSLSVLETARAFAAPIIMKHAGHHSTVDGILGEIGSIRVKYVERVMVEEQARNEGQIGEVELQTVGGDENSGSVNRQDEA